MDNLFDIAKPRISPVGRYIRPDIKKILKLNTNLFKEVSDLREELRLWQQNKEYPRKKL